MYSGATSATRFVAGALVLGTAGAVVWSVPRAAQPLAPSASPKATPSNISTSPRQQSTAGGDQLPRAAMEPSVTPASEPAEQSVDDRMTQPMSAPDPFAGDKKRIDRQITFDGSDVERRIRAFNVDCQRPGASMRLMDVLRLMAREGSFNGFETWLRIEGRGDDVRVYRDLLKDGVPQLRTKVVMELNKWDEIRLFGIHPDAIKIRCLLRDQRRS